MIIVNSCAVTAMAAKKSRHVLKNMRAKYPDSFLIITGCAADVEKTVFADKADFDLLLTNEEKKRIEEILREKIPSLNHPLQKSCRGVSSTEERIFFERAHESFPFRTRGILKVQEGCENFCTYCIVPYARGPERSRDLQETLDDFKRFLDAGVQEIVLSGVNICNYQCGRTNLTGLLEKLLEIPGDYRIRLSSTEPGPVLPDLIACMKESRGKVCSFLHLPLQSGSDAILRRMGRKYQTGEYLEFIRNARDLIEHIHIGTDLITGFPGETEEYFKESAAFAEKCSFANMHVFPYSPRAGTPAAKMPGRVTGKELERRIEYLS